MRQVAALVGLLALAVGGCIRPGVMVAKTGEHRLVARDAETGVSVILTTGAWDGRPADLEEEVTVVHALVANMSDQPVLLAPGDLELRDDRGLHYPLLDAGGSFHRQQPEDGSGAGYGPYRARRSYDPGRSDDYGTIRSPSGDVSAAALPWGVLEPGTQMRGFLYFEKLERTANEATLVWHLATPDHRPIVDLVFELYVARPKTRGPRSP